jgi:hypothetical protein
MGRMKGNLRAILTPPRLISGNPPVAVDAPNGEMRKIVSVLCIGLFKEWEGSTVLCASWRNQSEDSQKYLVRNVIGMTSVELSCVSKSTQVRTGLRFHKWMNKHTWQ